MKSVFKVLVFGWFTMALVGCSLLGEEDKDIPAPDAPGVTAGHEDNELSWSAVDGADEYVVYYVTDGSTVTKSSDVAYEGSGTSFTHSDLDSTTSYKYALAYRNSDGLSDISDATAAVQPEPVITLNVTFSSYANGDVGYRLIRFKEGDTSIHEQVFEGGISTDASSFAAIELDADRGKWYGFTVFKDNDDSDTLTGGDTVWGAGSDTYSIYSYPSTKPLEKSENILIQTWADFGSGTTGTL